MVSRDEVIVSSERRNPAPHIFTMNFCWQRNRVLTATAAWFYGMGHQVGIPGIPLPLCPEPTAGTAACCGMLAGCPGCGWSVAMETQSKPANQNCTNYNHIQGHQ